MSINQMFSYEIGYRTSTEGGGGNPELEPFEMCAPTPGLADSSVLSC